MRYILNTDHSSIIRWGKECNLDEQLQHSEWIYKNWKEYFRFNTYALYCPNCGLELYGSWRYNDVEKMNKDVQEACKELRESRRVITGESLLDDGPLLDELTYNSKSEIKDITNGMRKINKENSEEIKRIFTSDGLINCPYCQEPLSKNAGFFYSECKGEIVPDTFYKDFSPLWKELMSETTQESMRSADQCFDFLKKLRTINENTEFEKRTATLIEEYESLSSGYTLRTVDSISSSTKELKEYLKQLINLEMNIFSISKRIQNLFGKQKDFDRYTILSRIMTKKQREDDYQKKLENIKQRRNQIKETLENIENVHSRESFSLQYPPKPHIPPKPYKPTEPYYMKANLFNRKKVNEENDKLKRQYDSEMEQYNKDILNYENECKRIESDYSVECEKLDKQYNEKIVELQKQYQYNLDCLENELIEAQNEYDESVSDVSSSYFLAASELINNEIMQAKETLKSFVTTRKTYYDNDIIFPKYRNVVALSSFYEYVISGRCTALEGADGAYNLYEAESRADMIITQLSEVVTSLEEIKKNQYFIYSQINETNANLNRLNNTMNAALDSLIKIEESSGNIEETTHAIMDSNNVIARNAEIIAYNTEVTAFYSKKNAELTDALGLMIALK